MVPVPMNSMLLRSRAIVASVRMGVARPNPRSSSTMTNQQQQPSSSSSSSQPLNPSQVQLPPGMTLESLREQNHTWMSPDDESRCALAYCLSFSNDESDFQRNFTQLDSIMKTQLQYNQQFFQSSSSSMRNRRRATDPRKVACQQQHQPPKQQSIDTEPLPRTLQDALRPCKTRSIVITEKEAPFRIVNVNTCWEQLCGYSYVESKGKTLGSLLRGPQTDPLTATTIISKLLQGENDVGATLVNYKKNGQPFYNRIRAGPIYNEETGEISHFVGLLQEIGSELEHAYGNHSATQQHMYA